MPAPIVEDPVLRQRYSFTRKPDELGGELLEVTIWLDPGGGVTPHIHPSMEERFRVLSGQPSFLTGRKWRHAGPGDEVAVPSGTRHAYRNRSGEVAHLVCEARPPSLLQEFLEDVAVLSRAGKLMRPGLPKSFSGLLQVAVLAKHYREMAVLLVPPPFVQRLVLDPLVPLAERRGYKAGSFART